MEKLLSPALFGQELSIQEWLLYPLRACLSISHITSLFLGMTHTTCVNLGFWALPT